MTRFVDSLSPRNWRRRRGGGSSFSMATRLASIALFIVIVSLAVVSIVGIGSGRDLANDINERRIVNLGVGRASQVELYISGLRQQMTLLGQSPATADAIEAFAAATLEEAPTADQRAAVTDYYADVVVPALLEVRATPIGLSELVPGADPSIALQAKYVVDGEASSTGDRQDRSDDASATAWDELHDELHPVYRDIAAAAGFADLYLIEPSSNYVTYSVDKGIDFATSLALGPHSGSTLSGLVDRAIADPTVVHVADFASFTPSIDQPMMFMAVAVVGDDGVVGVVAARIDMSGIDSVMTGDGDWTGLGISGETYLVGPDATMRSEARLFAESPTAFTDILEERASIPTADLNRISELGTTVLIQPISDEPLELARAGEVGSIDMVNYLGVDVRSTYRSVDIDGVEWVLLTDIARDELAEPVVDYARDLLIAIAVILVVVTFAIVYWSRSVVAPLRRISDRLRAVRQDQPPTAPDGGTDNIRPSREFEALAVDIDTILEQWQERRNEIEERSDERRELVQRFLPPGIVARVEAGEQDVIDQIAQATVVTIVLNGLGRIVDTDNTMNSRDVVDRFVDDADEIARGFGLDRIELTGDAYTAICGTTKPYLDHAARSVSFGLAVADMVHDLSAELDANLWVGIGVDSGPVTVGLTGGAGLVYDAWGATVSASATVARVADERGPLVTSAVSRQLPTSFEIVEYDDADAPHAARLSLVTGVFVDEVTQS